MAKRPDRHRAAAAAVSRKKSEDSREIGDIPRVKSAKRRADCRKSLKRFALTYFPELFTLAFSPDHDRLIKSLERAVLKGELLALAMPRGSGKTTLCEIAALWAVLYGFRKFIVVVGADKDAAEALLLSVKTQLETNDVLAGDFPEVCYPIRALDGLANRCKGQTHRGNRTHIRWKDNEIALPCVPNSKCKGSIIKARGLTGRIRGLKFTTAEGKSIRPDLVIVDDPQTEDSARQPGQCQTRVNILSGAILGLAGPDSEIAGMMPCTVIEAGDMADQILDPELYPQWQGDRVSFVKSWPKRRDLWDEYCQIQRDDLRHKKGKRRCTAFYRKHRKAMDAGFKCYWPERKKKALSAQQHFFDELVKLGPQKVASEYQNDPECPELIQSDMGHGWHISAKQIAAKCSSIAPRTVHDDATKMTAMIDVHGDVLYWGVAAWSDNFTGRVVDYGTWPDQRVPFFVKNSAKHTLATKYPDLGTTEEQLHRGLADLIETKIACGFERQDATIQHVDTCMIDANWGEQSDTVYEYADLSPHRSILLPSHGVGVGVGKQRMDAAPAKPGEIVGHHWRMPSMRKSKRKIRYITFDANVWKVFLFRRLAAARGAAGCLELPGDNPLTHNLLASHCRVEKPIDTEGPHGKRVEWTLPPGADNHYFDIMIGLCVAASREGCALPGVQMTSSKKRRTKKRKKLSEMRR